MKLNLHAEAARLAASHIPFAEATIIRAAGSTPRTSAKMLVPISGDPIGTIGGGLAEAFIIRESRKCIEEGSSKVVEYRLDSGDSKNSIAMLCGGNLDIFIEVNLPARRIVLVGGGHVNLEIALLADKLGFAVEVAETRKDFCTKERFPMAVGLHCAETISEAVADISFNAETSVIIATHDHDGAALESLIGCESGFIGMLGSRRKVAYLKKGLREKGFGNETISRLRAPLGLDIGSETPEEIAVSIIAEVMMVQNGCTGRPLRYRGADNLVIVRGAGDIATGTIHRLHSAGFQVLALETSEPTVIRRPVAFATAVYEGSITIDGITAELADCVDNAKSLIDQGKVAVLVDPRGESVKRMFPGVVVDAILAKKNMGTDKAMAPIVIGLGPGFCAGEDVHAVVETSRGHYLGKVIYEGNALPNTGVPGEIAGYGEERVLRASATGRMKAVKTIGDTVKKGEVMAETGGKPVIAAIDGVVRGMLKNDIEVTPGFKIGDIDPRGIKEYCFSLSDKARAVAGGVVEAILHLSLNR